MTHPTEVEQQRQRPSRLPAVQARRAAGAPWAMPGTPGLEHRIGGLEKEDVTGNVSYDPANHEHMVRTRAQKIANIANEIPLLAVDRPGEGRPAGRSAGAAPTARSDGGAASAAQGHQGGPCPSALPQSDAAQHRRRAEALQEVLVPELNGGQLRRLLRATFLVDAVGLNKVQGRPFLVSEIEEQDRGTDGSGRRLHSESAERNKRPCNAAPDPKRPIDMSTLLRRSLPTLTAEGSRQRPGSALVPRLRRLLDPGPDEEGPGPAGHSARRWCSSPASAAPAASRTT